VKGMPRQLTTSMPMWLLAAASLTWIIVRLIRSREGHDSVAQTARRDAVVAAVLALGWLGLWLLYLNYTWTVSMVSGNGGPGGGVTVHVIRFYIPALGLIALLGTWLLVRLRAWMSWTALAALSLAGVLSFNTMASGASAGGQLGPGFGAHHGLPTLGGKPPNRSNGNQPGGGSRGVPNGVPPGAP
jgi:hypothetical protein